MYTLFVILIVIAAIMMIAIVLIQESKGGGLSTGFAGGNAVLGEIGRASCRERV